ncbi:MAG: ATP-dependent DNA helicase [Lachnospiraceae bacterium]|nr:ATP-dependent DNA helicase [Lachnospiraceae bacterium]
MESRISVRAFVEFLLQSGDIDNRVRAVSETAMREGARLHKRIQASRGADYQAEVPLSFSFDTGRYTLRIDGRADGLMLSGDAGELPEEDGQLSLFSLPAEEAEPAENLPPEEELPLIEEIKGTYRDVKKLEAPLPVHLAQAKCYAHFLCLQRGFSAVRVQMTYGNLDTEELKLFRETHTAASLAEWFDGLLKRYLVWTDLRYDWAILRTESIRQTVFPFAYREGQKELAAAVYRTIIHGRQLFLEAPTGSGKTLSTVFPAIKAIGEGKAERLFYLTARTITRQAAEEAVRLLREGSGLRFKTVTLTAKEKICPQEQCECNPEACPYAKGHFDRILEALYELVTEEEHFPRDVILRYANRHTVCPFELSLDASLFADGIICDYNYVYDPFVYLRRFFAEDEKGAHIFLTDEAHNLVERGREMYSAALPEKELLKAMRAVQKATGFGEIRAGLRELLSETEEAARELKGKSAAPYHRIDDLMRRVNGLSKALSDFMEKPRGTEEQQKEMRALFLTLYRFRTIYERMDARYRVLAMQEAAEGFFVAIRCVDPSGDLAACTARGIAGIFFSATLLPVQYYKRLLGGTKEDFEIYAKTSFAPERLGVFVVSDVTSRYTARGEESYRRIALAVEECVRARRGNYMVFFPSFSFLEEVSALYRPAPDGSERLIVQAKDMTEEARERVLAQFQGCRGAADGVSAAVAALPGVEFEIEEVEDVGVTLFAVLGGIFNEGVDLPGDALIGVCIVGTGLPQVGTERDIIRDWFDEASGDGFDYAYRYPGMNRVLQAAGRVIRTEEDLGVVVLLDERFRETRVRTLFPREWQGIKTVGTDEVRQALSDFWKEWEITS